MLDRLQLPADLRALTPGELQAVADAVRARLIDVCSRTGGHIGAGLGVVELSVALHAAFETPRDQLVWDVGHQGYPHKLLTGRNDRMEIDPAGGGAVRLPQARARASTTPSAPGTRPPRSRRHLASPPGATCRGMHYKVVAIIGDGSLTQRAGVRRRSTMPGTATAMSSSCSTTTRCRLRRTSGRCTKYLNQHAAQPDSTTACVREDRRTRRQRNRAARAG
jgi:hypothetical protein